MHNFRLDGFLAAGLALLLSVCAFGQNVTPDAHVYTALYQFAPPPDGSGPDSGVFMDSQGNLYGTTRGGGTGPDNNGTVYQLTPPVTPGNPWTETVIYSFQGGADGGSPESPVIQVGTSQDLYGTTYAGGGSYGTGTVYQLAAPAVAGGAWSYELLYAFGQFPGDAYSPPNKALVSDGANLYGTTAGGGLCNQGTVYELSPPSVPGGAWAESILHSFCGGPLDGSAPSTALIRDRHGNLYGTTILAGANGLGTVFKLSPPAAPGGNWSIAILHSFGSSGDGSEPAGPVVFDKKGALYGTTVAGGTYLYGTVFQLKPPATPGSPWTEMVLYSFKAARDGGQLADGVIVNGKGVLFGTTPNGGSHPTGNGAGVVFGLIPPTTGSGPWKEAVLHTFTGPDGYKPICKLVMRKGILYGTTNGGDTGGAGGVVFSLKP